MVVGGAPMLAEAGKITQQNAAASRSNVCRGNFMSFPRYRFEVSLARPQGMRADRGERTA
jgi:hypothetical protein